MVLKEARARMGSGREEGKDRKTLDSLVAKRFQITNPGASRRERR